MGIDELIVISNVALVVVTAGAIWASVRESHHHEEAVLHVSDEEDARLVKLVHDVLQHENEEEKEQAAAKG